MRRLKYLTLLLPFLFYTPTVNAQEKVFYSNYFAIEEVSSDYSGIVINEVMPNPEGSDSDYEWIEIYNDLSDGIDLSSCSIDGKVFPDGTIIGGEEYLIVAKDLDDASDGDGQSFEERWGDTSGTWGDGEEEDYSTVQLSISLKNSDDSVVFECPDYDYDYEFVWEESVSGQSLSLDEDGEVTDTYLVTPGRENAAPEPIVYDHSILIIEIYPAPSDEESEWIELYNYGGGVIQLDGWIIEDNTKKQKLSGEYTIESKKYLVLGEEDLNITLNNSGETITLYDPNEEIVDEFEYESSKEGISNIRKWKNDHYLDEIAQTQKPTKGKQNEYIDPADLFYGRKLLSIAEARKLDIGEEVVASGIITVDLNLLGKKVFYIQDGTSAIQVYFSDEAFAKSFESGVKVKLLGELKESKGELRIYINQENAIEEISADYKVKPGLTKTGKIGEATEGQLVMVIGKIVKTSGSSFYIDDGSGKIKILVKSSTGIETPRKKKGQYAGIVGIASQYGEDAEGNSVYRVLPRYKTDIVISDEPLSAGQVLAATGSSTLLWQLCGVGVLLLLLKIRKTKTKCQNK